MSTLAEIRLNRIFSNALLLRRRAKKPVYAVVKDDAYGHGAIEVAHTLEPLVCGFCVATPSEGAALRASGIQGDILVLTPPITAECAYRMKAYRLIATVDAHRTLRLLPEGSEAHIAVNTGMNRYGVRPGSALSVAREAAERGIAVTGVFSHLYAAEDEGARQAQVLRFRDGAEGVRSIFPSSVRHLGATAGLFADVGFDAMRAGIGLYGYAPKGFSCSGLLPAMKVYATVMSRRKQFGEGAGYNVAPHCGQMYTLSYGYGDGFFRVYGCSAGNLCMDACVEAGDAPVGERRLIMKDAEAYGRSHGTTAYEVLVRLGRGAERIYVR